MLQIPLLIEIDLEVNFAMPAQASQVLQKIGMCPPLLLPTDSTEWDIPHDHRRVAAELLLANLALERVRQLFARGLQLEVSGSPLSDDAWFQRDETGNLALKRNWLSEFLNGVPDDLNQEPTSDKELPDTDLEIGLEIFQITFDSPTHVKAGLWVKVKELVTDRKKRRVIAVFAGGILSAAVAAGTAVSHNSSPPGPITCHVRSMEPLTLPEMTPPLTDEERKLQEVLYQGMTSRDERVALRNVQQGLAELDCYGREVDGRPGPETNKAVKTYAERIGVVTTTWKHPRFLTRLSGEVARLHAPPPRRGSRSGHSP